MKTLSSSEVVRNFGATLQTAQVEPVRVQSHGRDVVYIVSPAAFERLRNLDRQILTLEELSDADFQAAMDSQPAPEAARFDGEVDG